MSSNSPPNAPKCSLCYVEVASTFDEGASSSKKFLPHAPPLPLIQCIPCDDAFADSCANSQSTWQLVFSKKKKKVSRPYLGVFLLLLRNKNRDTCRESPQCVTVIHQNKNITMFHVAGSALVFMTGASFCQGSRRKLEKEQSDRSRSIWMTRSR